MDNKKEEKILTLDDDLDEDDSDRTVIQGIKDLTASLENRAASLIVISGSSAGKMFKLENEPMNIGRSKDCKVCLPEEGISRNHARVEHDEYGNAIIVDLGSTNGTYFNGSRINRHILRDGDKIQVGSTTILKFSFQDSIEEAFHQNQYNQAIKDGLTGAFNKRHFKSKLREEFAYSIRHNEPMSLILMDLDHFKRVNDTFGHPAGDMVLRKMTDVAKKALREEDAFFRYGGEEFGVILRNQNDSRAYVAAERVRRAIETTKFIWENKRIPLTVSIGIATLNRANYRDPKEMLADADEYLYKSKHSGRNRTSSAIRQ